MHLSINKGRWVKTDSYACKNNDTTLTHFFPFPTHHLPSPSVSSTITTPQSHTHTNPLSLSLSLLSQTGQRTQSLRSTENHCQGKMELGFGKEKQGKRSQKQSCCKWNVKQYCCQGNWKHNSFVLTPRLFCLQEKASILSFLSFHFLQPLLFISFIFGLSFLFLVS